MQKSVFSIWITSLYGSQPSSVLFARKTATFGQELPVSMGPSPHLSFCACKTAWFAPEYQIYGSQPLSVVFAYKTATFGAELQVSMDPRHNLSFWACKRACLAPELLVSMCPRSHLCFCREYSMPSIRITSLYWSQPSCAVFGCKTATFGPE